MNVLAGISSLLISFVLLADGEIGNVGAVEVVQLVVTEADFIAVKMSKFWRFALSQKSLPWRIILSSSATNSPGMSAARNAFTVHDTSSALELSGSA